MSLGLTPRQILIAPVVSEKSYSLIEASKYSFRVHPSAHKTQIRMAVEELFEVKVVAVNVLKVSSKPKRRGTHRGRRPGWKKAIVQLREGDKIEIFEGAGVV
jgi:large subunit ribosomal protein L23